MLWKWLEELLELFFLEELDVEIQTGWWFQTFLFSISYISDVILPIDELHHFSRCFFQPHQPAEILSQHGEMSRWTWSSRFGFIVWGPKSLDHQFRGGNFSTICEAFSWYTPVSPFSSSLYWVHLDLKIYHSRDTMDIQQPIEWDASCHPWFHTFHPLHPVYFTPLPPLLL